MIAHDLTFETLAQAPVKQTDVIVARQTALNPGYEDDPTMVWSSSTALMSVGIDAVGEMLGTATKKATVKLLGIVPNISASELFQVRLGLYNSDTSTFDYISQGFFIVDTVDYDYDLGSTTVNMYDHMWKANKTPYTTTFIYPCTVKQLAEQIAGAIGVTVDADFADLPNADHVIVADLYAIIANATLLTVIQEIAGATGTTARISDTKLEFVPFSIQSEYIDGSLARRLKVGDFYGPVTSVVLGRVPQNDNIVMKNATLTNGTISDIDSITNTIVVIGHGLPDGTLIQIQSTATLPEPLQPLTNYYIYTNGSADSFSLAPTYKDALAGTNLIDLLPESIAAPIVTDSFGSPYYGYYDSFIDASIITLTPLKDTQIQINNNQILDGDRQTMLPPLYAALLGVGWAAGKSDTIGLPWHEVGDVIKFKPVDISTPIFLNEVHYILAGSINETLLSKIPNEQSINYQTAGGILKTLYNAEIKVDKQANQITTIVSEQEIVNNQVQEDFTQIRQDVDSIDINIQNSGGNNLLSNSVGYATDQVPDRDATTYGKIYAWDYKGLDGASVEDYAIAEHGTVVSSDSSVSQNLGGVSGRAIRFDSNYGAGKGVRLTQRVDVAVGAPLSFSVRVYSPGSLGTATITLSNTNESSPIAISSSAHNWEEFKVENFITSLPWLDVTIESKAQALEMTDLTLMYGVTIQKWTQADTEIMSTNVQFTIDGIRVYNPLSDLETRITNTDFQTVRRSDGAILFEADNTGVRANDFTIRGSSDYYIDGASVIKQITIPYDDPKGGIAFLKGTE